MSHTLRGTRLVCMKWLATEVECGIRDCDLSCSVDSTHQKMRALRAAALADMRPSVSASEDSSVQTKYRFPFVSFIRFYLNWLLTTNKHPFNENAELSGFWKPWGWTHWAPVPTEGDPLNCCSRIGGTLQHSETKMRTVSMRCYSSSCFADTAGFHST
jgi:hypothetical protein